jgi:hypothetical protein
MAKPKFGYPSLALLDWLCEKGVDRRLFTAGGGMSSRGAYLYEASEPNAEGKRSLRRIWPTSGPIEKNPDAQALLDRLGGRDTIDYTAMYQAKFLKGFNALGHNDIDQARGRKSYETFVAKFDRNYFHFSESAIIVTPDGYRYWEEYGREATAKMRADRESARSAAARTVVIGCTCTVRPRLSEELKRRIPEGVVLPLPMRRIIRPYATATFVKETPMRVYVRDVRALPEIGETYWRNRPVGGNAPNQYVSPEAIMVNGCDQSLAEKLHAIAIEFQDDIDAIGERIAAEMLPGLIDLNSRILQKDAERADAVADALREAGHKVPAPYDPPDPSDDSTDTDVDQPSPGGP